MNVPVSVLKNVSVSQGFSDYLVCQGLDKIAPQ